jgi:hypothetical protein
VRFKIVPEPRPPEFVDRARLAMPLVPGDEDDCCARLMADTDLAARSDAREWITFLRALGLVAESDGAYYRTREDVDGATLAARFRERIHPAAEVLDALADAETPLAADTAFERVLDEVPQWERARRSDWEAVWRERVERILEWAVAFDLAERADGGYRPTGGPSADG